MAIERKFPKEGLVNKWGDFLVPVVHDEIVDHLRWDVMHEAVFQHEDAYWRTHYRVGATENQDYYPFEYDDVITATQVVEEEVTVKRWVDA